MECMCKCKCHCELASEDITSCPAYHDMKCKHCNPIQENIDDWEQELNKWYGLMFECGDYEALVDFIRNLLASSQDSFRRKVEEEVIGEDEVSVFDIKTQIEKDYLTWTNQLRAEQRLKLKTLRP